MDGPPSLRPALRAAAIVGVLLLALHIAHGQLGLGGHSLDTLIEQWVYDAVVLGGGISCLVRGSVVREERVAWLVLGAGLVMDAAGEIYYSIAFGNSGTPPVPSLADLFYLLYYPATYIALVMLVRGRVHRFSPSTWLDGGIAAATSTAVIAALFFEPILRGATHGSVAAVATNLAYPVGDMLLLAIIFGVFALSGWQPGRRWLVLSGGLALTAIADTTYLYASTQGTYRVGGILDSMWVAAALCIGFAAWQPLPTTRKLHLDGRRLLVIPCFFGLTAVGVLFYGGVHHVATAGLVCAATAVVLMILRGAWMFKENVGLLERSRHEAVTDALTGIGNRRKLNDELDRALAEGAASPWAVLVMFDLDGFKLYNDNFGHMAGDTLLAHFGRQLAASVEQGDEVYRLGGDEFCVLLRGASADVQGRVESCRAALLAAGEGFAVTASFGQVSLPDEADTPTLALRIADDRMYAQKGSRRGSARQQTHDVLLGLLREREPELHDHLREVGRLAVAVGRRLGMDAEQLDELSRAAELHDIGKAAIPDGILKKRGPLDEQEMAFMRRHTLIGERILATAPALAPVAGLVRSSHERWDGSGYPDQIAGEAIPLGARIVAVCDAFDAITSDRPYARARTVQEALAELRQSAGSQFDPAVVDAFQRAWREHALDDAGTPAAAGSLTYSRR
jgi:two-component system cell cycle response regulator